MAKEKENKKKIMVVDDEPDNTSIFSMGLEDGGFEVESPACSNSGPPGARCGIV